MPTRDLYGFSLDVPGDWLDRSVLVLQAPSDAEAEQRNLTINCEPRRAGEPEAAVFARYRRELSQQGMPDLQLGETVRTELAGFPASLTELSHGLPGGARLELVRKQAVILTPRWVVLVMFTANERSYPRCQAELERILTSLKLPAALCE